MGEARHRCHFTGFRVERELNIGTTGFDPYARHNLFSCIAHGLEFYIGQGLSRCHCDTVTRVDSHGIEVFNGTDDDKVVGHIPHDLELIFLPAEY